MQNDSQTVQAAWSRPDENLARAKNRDPRRMSTAPGSLVALPTAEEPRAAPACLMAHAGTSSARPTRTGSGARGGARVAVGGGG